MRFFTIAACMLRLSAALYVERLPSSNSNGLPGFNSMIDDNDLALLGLDSASVDALAILRELYDNGDIDIMDDDETGLSKRQNVPGLQCGKSRAVRCALSTGGVVAICIWAVIARGKDMKENTKCGAGALALGANMATDCRKCLGIALP